MVAIGMLQQRVMGRGGRRAVCWLLCSLFAIGVTQAQNRVVYPRLQAGSEEGAVMPNEYYPVEVLRLALQHSGEVTELAPSEFVVPQGRHILLLQAGRDVDVLWTVTSVERENQLLPIRIPIDRGLYGWRLLMIRRGDQARFSAVDGLSALARMVGVQGHDWPDTTILQTNGLGVDPVSGYHGLFEMLARGRVDYFPRAVPEIWGEVDDHASLQLEVEQELVLHYPSAMYFFVGPRNEALAGLIRRGLERAIDDGSFAALFQRFHGDSIARARLHARRVFTLRNPVLPEATPVDNPRYWYTPEGKP